MATYNKFQQVTLDLVTGVHNLAATGDTLKVYLTNNTPDAAADSVLADLIGITEEHGYTARDIQNDISESSGIVSLTGVDVVFTASGGSFGPFRYAVIYNDTATSPADPLIAWWDYGSETTVSDGEFFTIDFAPSIFILS